MLGSTAMPPRPYRALAAFVALVLMSAGCSFTLVHRAPVRPRYGERIECVDEKAFPIIDSAIALAYPVGAGVRLAVGEVRRSDGTVDPAPNPAVLIPLALAGGAIFGWSAWTGFRHTSHCAEIQRQQAESRPGVTP